MKFFFVTFVMYFVAFLAGGFWGWFLKGQKFSSTAARKRQAGGKLQWRRRNLTRLVKFPTESGGPPSRANEWEKGSQSIDEDN